MSETLKNGGGKSIEGTGTSRLEALTEMSGKFNPEKARSLAGEDKTKNQKPQHRLISKFFPISPKRSPSKS